MGGVFLLKLRKTNGVTAKGKYRFRTFSFNMEEITVYMYKI